MKQFKYTLILFSIIWTIYISIGFTDMLHAKKRKTYTIAQTQLSLQTKNIVLYALQMSEPLDGFVYPDTFRSEMYFQQIILAPSDSNHFIVYGKKKQGNTISKFKGIINNISFAYNTDSLYSLMAHPQTNTHPYISYKCEGLFTTDLKENYTFIIEVICDTAIQHKLSRDWVRTINMIGDIQYIQKSKNKLQFKCIQTKHIESILPHFYNFDIGDRTPIITYSYYKKGWTNNNTKWWN